MSAHRPPAGVTLLELLFVTVLLGIVGGAVMTVIVRQQRFYGGAGHIVDARSQLRQAAGILPAEIRGISTAGGDVRFLSDSAFEFRATYGSAIICAVDGATITLPPATLANGNLLTSFLSQPVSGDVIFVHDTLAPASAPWTQHVIAADPTTTTATCRPDSRFVTPADDATPRITFSMSPPPGAGSGPGSAIRFTRPVRYSLYRASDQRWYLGYNEQRQGAWLGLQPVSGPYRPYATSPSASGVSFQYFTENGAPVTTTAAATTVARVQFSVNGQAMQATAGAAAGVFEDSLRTAVAIRNRL